MFSGIMSNIAKERASLARDVEFIRENVKDSDIQENILVYECCENCGTVYTDRDIVSKDEEDQIKEAISKIPDDNSEEEEINRIVTSEKPEISIDEVMGISSPDEPNPTDIAFDAMMND